MIFINKLHLQNTKKYVNILLDFIMKMFKFFTLLLAIPIISCTHTAKTVDVRTVNNFDISKYLGTWHEIARFDHSFEKGCDNVTATYSQNDDGSIGVLNRCVVNGKEKVAKGKAYFRDAKMKNKGELKVTFFWPFFGHYNVLELDKDYQYALVSGSSDGYLWVLSRSKTMEKATLDALLARATARGFDVSKFIYPK
jgi:apolipoprotein D and lipocalin family protein